jgi:hypothetical protein
VAQHSLLVEQLMPEGTDAAGRLIALLHDAHEAYVGDLITPVKQALARVNMAFDENVVHVNPAVFFDEITRRLDQVIWQTFGLNPSWELMDHVKTADLLALAVEKELLMAPARRDWGMLPKLPDSMPVLQPVRPPQIAAGLFLDRFRVLQDERYGLTK